MNIGIDIDDTISNTYDVLMGYAQKYTAEDLKKELKQPEAKILSCNGYCEKFHNWNEEETRNFWEKYYSTIIKEVTIKKFAKETIKKLKKDGHKIYLITARFDVLDGLIKQITLEWLEENGIEYDELIFDAQDKLKKIKEKNIEILIDDAVTNCTQVSEAGIKTYIMDSMQNHGQEIENVQRLYSWIHAEQEINKLNK